MTSKSNFTRFTLATLFSSLSLAHASSSSHYNRNSNSNTYRQHQRHNDFVRRALNPVEVKAHRRQDTGSGSAAEYALVGCFSELPAAGTHVLNHPVAWNQTNIQSCVEACYHSGAPLVNGIPSPYTFAGIVNGAECRCDNAMSSIAAQVDQSNCQSTCAQGTDGWCGGPSAYQIYYLPSAVNGNTPTSVVPTVAGTVDAGQAPDGTAAQYGLLGCFVDDPNSRTLRGPTFTGDNVTPQTCSSYCYAQGYPFAGVEYGNECFCGASIFTATPSEDCTQACSGDSTSICGAPARITVYQLFSSDTVSGQPIPEVPPIAPGQGPWISAGCFADDTSNRAMTSISFINPELAALLNPGSLSVQGCTDACAHSGFTFAGLEFGSECYCSNSLPPVQTDLYDCNMPCPVGGGTCGGGLRLNVYTLPV